jgi:hypothetical protein
MAAPTIQSIQYTGTTLYIIFSEAIAATGGSELNGFTFTKTPGPVVIVPVFSSIDQNAMICTLPGPILSTETLTVDYNDALGTVVDAATGTFPAPSFTGQVGVPYYTTPLVRRAQVAYTAVNDQVTVFFGEPVGSPTNDLVTGFTIEVDNVALDLTSATATLNDDQTELTIDVGVNFAYDNTVDVIYASGTGDLYSWTSGAVGDFTLNDIDNLSTDGLPNSSYPLSTVIGPEPTICENAVTACVQISLNPIDIELVQKYGSVTVVTGGTFGTAPNEITIVGRQAEIVDGAEICETFTDPANVVYAADAANDWQDEIVTRIGIALGAIRAIDQSVTLNSLSVNQV